MKSSELINEIKLITQDNVHLLSEQFAYFNAEQRNWKLDKNVWNINEILAHLNEYAIYYHEVFLNKIANTKYKEPREIFISSPLGRAAWKSMKLGNLNNVKRKMKSPKQYNPLNGDIRIGDRTVELFIEKQQELLNIIDLAATVNLKKVKIPISISKIIRLRLGDALLFISYHNQRHMQQIKNLVKHPNFPKQ